MGIILILVIAIVAAVFVIRSRIIHIQRSVQAAIDDTLGVATKGTEVVARVGAKAARAAATKVKGVANRDNRGRRRAR